MRRSPHPDNVTHSGNMIHTGQIRWDNADPVVHHKRLRFTTAQVNAGATVLSAIPGWSYRMVDCALIAVGGAASGATTVDILGTQSESSVKLVAADDAQMTENALVRVGDTDIDPLAAGASFVANDPNTAITIGKTGSDLATATHVDVLISYTIER